MERTTFCFIKVISMKIPIFYLLFVQFYVTPSVLKGISKVFWTTLMVSEGR